MKKLTLAFGLLASMSAVAQSEIKTTVFGDLRLRNESIDSEGSSGKDTYDQLRLRARLGVKAQINETLSSEFRLATGPGGRGTNQTLGQTGSTGSRNYDFKLDRAYFRYSADSSLVVKAGRTDNPYVLVGDNNMLFDADLNFDGGSISYTHKMESMSFQLVLAHTILAEDASNVNVTDSALNTAQLAWRMNFGDIHSLLLTVADHSFTNLKGQNVLTEGAAGNSVSGGNYLYNYDVTSVGLEYGLKTSIPMVFFAEVANNNRTSENDSATIYGLKVNKLKKKGDWSFSIDSREVEKDSTVGALTDSDSFGGGTDGRSLNTSIGYGLDDNANLVVSYLTGETFISSGATSVDRNRVQVDLNVKF